MIMNGLTMVLWNIWKRRSKQLWNMPGNNPTSYLVPCCFEMAKEKAAKYLEFGD